MCLIVIHEESLRFGCNRIPVDWCGIFSVLLCFVVGSRRKSASLALVRWILIALAGKLGPGRGEGGYYRTGFVLFVLFFRSSRREV